MGSTKSLARRLERLEVAAPSALAPEPSEEDLRFAEALQRLLNRMDPRHAGLVWDDWKTRGDKDRDQALHASGLASIAFHYVHGHLRGGTPLELPAEVAEAYLTDPSARPIHECEDCGYDLPFRWAEPLSRPPRPVAIYFDRCPLCGGKVGWHAFYMKHKRYKSAQESANSSLSTD